MDEGRCRSCGKRILWAQSALTGARVPLDPEPVTSGGGFVQNEHGMLVWTTSGERRASHFATCPQAAEWRGKGGKV
jgi:hypothetical protein